MSLSENPEYEKALRIDNRLKELKLFGYLNSLDLVDLLLIRDTYYLFCGGGKSKEEKAITKILKERGIKEMKKKKTEKKKTIEPCGTITPTKDLFKFKSENMGVFPKPEIERKDNNEGKEV